MRLLPLPKGPRTVRLQDNFPWRSDFASKLAKGLAQTLVIELDANDDAGWDERRYLDLLALLRKEKIVSLTLANARFDYGYKEADDRYDGIMGWMRAFRKECVGPSVARCIEEAGLPSTLRELSFRDAGLDAAHLKSVLSALPRELQKLDVRDNDIGSEGLRALVAAGLPSLTELRVGWKGNTEGYGVLVDSMARRPGCVLIISMS